MSERLDLTTSDGVTLEARIDSPEVPQRFTVLCHPHPLQGGSMNAPLMIAVTSRLNDRGHAVLRFNFRGTGASTGSHDYGGAELADLDAAFDVANTKGLPLSLAGWSFGGGVSLRWLATRETTLPWVGIAPSHESLPDEVPAGPKRIVLGTRDQVIDGSALRDYAVEKGIDVVLTPGDHFFHGRGKKIGDLVAQGLES